MQAPWTEIGRLESDVRDIQSTLHNKADSHEIHQINSRLDSLEHSLREISTSFAEVQSELQELQRGQIMLLEDRASSLTDTHG